MPIARAPLSRPASLAVAGWLGVVVFAGLMAVFGEDSLGNAMFFAVIGLTMAAWVGLRRSRPALWVSLVLGLLHVVEQVAYLVADAPDAGAGLLTADAVGLVAGVLVVTGSARELRERRRQRRQRQQDAPSAAAAASEARAGG